MQRLRRVRQLGTTHLVYPGATHTRFSHALGTLRAAQDLMDIALSQRWRPDFVPDLFDEWERDGDINYDSEVARATVLARLGALLHDLGHIPFGHTLEDDLCILDPHDQNEERFKHLWSQLKADLLLRTDIVPGGIKLEDQLAEQLKPLIISKPKSRSVAEVLSDQEMTGQLWKTVFGELAARGRRDVGDIDVPVQLIDSLQSLSIAEPESASSAERQCYPFVTDIIGNTICADLIDYLQRDHLYTGMPADIGRRFLDGFYVTRSTGSNEHRRMVVRIKRAGRLRSDIVSELLKYLRYRYELSERVLVHHAKLGADVMIGKMFEMWSDALETELADGPSLARLEIEEQVRKRGDDGLLEYLIDEAGRDVPQRRRAADKRWQGIRELAHRIQNRDLFKNIGAFAKIEMAEHLYKQYGPSDKRAELERDAARYVKADHGWMVALWIPNPSMRFKAAKVLVDAGQDGVRAEIVPLEAWDRENGGRGFEIVESHRKLWAMRVYADRRLSKEQRAIVLARLESRLPINGWNDATPTLARLSAERVCREQRLTAARLDELEQEALELLPKRPEDDTFDAFVQTLSDTITRDGLAGLREWEQRKVDQIRHPQLDELIAEVGESSLVRVNGSDLPIESAADVSRVNSRMWVHELREEGSRTLQDTEAYGSVTKFIDDFPDNFEDQVGRKFSEVGSEAARTRQVEEVTNRSKLAFEDVSESVVELSSPELPGFTP